MRADLHRFKAFIEMQELEAGAWRGVIEEGELVEEHPEDYDAQREYSDIEDKSDDLDDEADEPEDDAKREQRSQPPRRQRSSGSKAGGRTKAARRTRAGGRTSSGERTKTGVRAKSGDRARTEKRGKAVTRRELGNVGLTTRRGGRFPDGVFERAGLPVTSQRGRARRCRASFPLLGTTRSPYRGVRETVRLINPRFPWREP